MGGCVTYLAVVEALGGSTHTKNSANKVHQGLGTHHGGNGLGGWVGGWVVWFG